MKEHHNVTIREAYKAYSPPIDAGKVVDKLLSGIPKKRLAGIKTVVLTDSANMTAGELRARARARGRTFRVRDCRGRYHPKWKGELAWIQIFVDNCLSDWPRFSLRIPFIREMLISEPLFHEVGHHIHANQEPEYRDGELVADNWESRLHGYYYRRKHWYLIPIAIPFWVVKRISKKMRKRKPTVRGFHRAGARGESLLLD